MKIIRAAMSDKTTTVIIDHEKFSPQNFAENEWTMMATQPSSGTTVFAPSYSTKCCSLETICLKIDNTGVWDPGTDYTAAQTRLVESLLNLEKQLLAKCKRYLEERTSHPVWVQQTYFPRLLRGAKRTMASGGLYLWVKNIVSTENILAVNYEVTAR